MFLGGLLVIGLIIFVVIALTNRPADHHSNYNAGNSYSPYNVDESLNILNMRYARGEITDDEYRKMKATLLNK